MASEPYASAVHTESKPSSSARFTMSTGSSKRAPEYPSIRPSFMARTVAAARLPRPATGAACSSRPRRAPYIAAMTIPLRHGVFLAPFHSVTENPTLALDRDLQLMVLLDELGFHGVDRRAPLGRHGDDRLARLLHRRSGRAHQAPPLRHRGGVAASTTR